MCLFQGRNGMEWVIDRIKEEDSSNKVKQESSDILTQLETKFKREAEDLKQSMDSFFHQNQTNTSPLWSRSTLGCCYVSLWTSGFAWIQWTSDSGIHCCTVACYALCDQLILFLYIWAIICDKVITIATSSGSSSLVYTHGNPFRVFISFSFAFNTF